MLWGGSGLFVLLPMMGIDDAGGLALGLFGDVACAGQGPLGHHGTKDLVDQNAEENDEAHGAADLTAAKNVVGGHGGHHTQGHARLGQEGDAQVLHGLVVALHGFGAGEGTRDLTEGSEEDVDDADQDEDGLLEHRQIQAGAADDEEQDEEGLGPLLGPLHHFLRGLTDIAEDGAQHHAGQEGGEADVYPAHLEVEHGEGHGQHDKGNHEGETVAVGMEHPLDQGQDKAQDRAQEQGQDDLQKGLHQDGDHVESTAMESLGHAHGDGEENETHGVVQSDDGQEQVGQRALGLVLAHHHKGGGGSGGRGDGAQDDAGGEGEIIGPRHGDEQEMHADQGGVHHQGGDHGLDDTDDGGLLTRMLEVLEAELVTDIKGDEAQGDIRDDGEITDGGDLVVEAEAEAADGEAADAVGAHHNAGDEVGGDVGKMEPLEGTGHHQSGDKAHRQAEQSLNGCHRLSLVPCKTGFSIFGA